MPDFQADVPDIDPFTLSKLDEPTRLMALTLTGLRKDISILRKETRWLAEKVIIVHNISVEHEKLIESTRKTIFGIPLKFFIWVGTAAGGAFIVKVVELWKK